MSESGLMFPSGIILLYNCYGLINMYNYNNNKKEKKTLLQVRKIA